MMKQIFLLIACFLTAAALYAQEEFNGPLPAWVNIKTRFGVKGNGTTDDTKGIQQALDSLTQPVISYNMGKSAYMVIYLPAGTYTISSTLILKGKIGVSFIGESPANTIIRWKGSDNNTMFLSTGSAYIKVSRFTWDANGHKDIEAIGMHWKEKITDGRSTSSAPVNNEFSDNVFTGHCKYGISGGTLPGEGTTLMDSEISIRRCVFDNCETGIQVKGYNALDYWIWDCSFIKCDFGVKCNSGNYHIYRSYFSNCYSDVENTNSYYTSLRGCYSENSSHFSYDQGSSTNPFKRVFQGNTVIAPKLIPVISYHLGKIMLMDNILDSASNNTVKSFVETGSWAGGQYQVLSISNKYRNRKAVQFNVPAASTLFSYNDLNGPAVVNNKTAFFDTQDKLPPKVVRQVFTVPAGANARKIQDIINQAVKLKGNRPVVYFPMGRYSLDEPIVIPANADIQLIGDGYLYATMLLPSANFQKGKALVEVLGPTGIVIKDVQLGDFANTTQGTDGIHFVNTDQPGAKAFIEQLYTNSTRSLHADNLDFLYIQETNSFYSAGKLITGGPLVQQGKGTSALHCFGGQFAGLSTDKNASAVMKDCWWEGATRRPLNFAGSGNITIDGAMIAPDPADSNTTISINRFAGKISLLNMYVQGGVQVDKNNPQLNLLLWNIHFYHAMNPLKFNTADASYKGAFIGLTTQCFIPGEKKCDNIFTVPDAIKGNVKMETFFPDMLSADRSSLPVKYIAGKSGISNIFISRVSAGGCNTAISFEK